MAEVECDELWQPISGYTVIQDLAHFLMHGRLVHTHMPLSAGDKIGHYEIVSLLGPGWARPVKSFESVTETRVIGQATRDRSVTWRQSASRRSGTRSGAHGPLRAGSPIVSLARPSQYRRDLWTRREQRHAGVDTRVDRLILLDLAHRTTTAVNKNPPVTRPAKRVAPSSSGREPARRN
jgi:hypothetical protein